MAKAAAPYVHATLAAVDATLQANLDGSVTFTWLPPPGSDDSGSKVRRVRLAATGPYIGPAQPNETPGGSIPKWCHRMERCVVDGATKLRAWQADRDLGGDDDQEPSGWPQESHACLARHG